MSGLAPALRQFVRGSSCKRPITTSTPWTRSYSAPTYSQQVSDVQQALSEAVPQSSAAPHKVPDVGLKTVRENKFVTPGRFSVKAFEQHRFPRKPPYVGPDAKTSRYNDAFYQLGIDPLDECTNARLLSDFVTEMGKIKSRAVTGLTWRSQRRLSKAIRRAKMMGVMPMLSKRTKLPF